jgi:hypothetical protein
MYKSNKIKRKGAERDLGCFVPTLSPKLFTSSSVEPGFWDSGSGGWGRLGRALIREKDSIM